jgi:SNF2 family DNA or RNA helicase
MRVIPDAIEVRGSMNPIEKEDKLVAFSEGNARVIITKPSVAGFGLNWQHCHKMAFIGLSFKYEEYYQATRRCYRFGQTKPVEVHVVGSEAEMRIDQVIKRKSNDHEKMKKAMSESMARAYIKRGTRETYQPKTVARLPF